MFAKGCPNTWAGNGAGLAPSAFFKKVLKGYVYISVTVRDIWAEFPVCEKFLGYFKNENVMNNSSWFISLCRSRVLRKNQEGFGSQLNASG